MISKWVSNRNNTKMGLKHETIIKWVSNRNNNTMGFKQKQ